MVKNIASWSDRLFAWLIDFVIIAVVAGYGLSLSLGGMAFLGGGLIFFIYWTILEYYRGQSVGKIVFNLKVVNKYGKSITIVQSAIQSFGKSFLLPIDVIIGWIFFPRDKQRLFNRVSDTFVIRLSKK